MSPGQFDYYALVLSWSPTYCAEKGDSDNDRSATAATVAAIRLFCTDFGRSMSAAILRTCQLPRRPFVPRARDRQHARHHAEPRARHPRIPHARNLLGARPKPVFFPAHRLFDGIKIPERFRNPFNRSPCRLTTSAANFCAPIQSFAPNMVAVVCGGRGKPLKEVRFCLSKDGKPRACGNNENQSKLCSTDLVSVPPARSTARDRRAGPAVQPSHLSYEPAQGYQNSPLPGPRMIDDGHRQRRHYCGFDAAFRRRCDVSRPANFVARARPSRRRHRQPIDAMGSMLQAPATLRTCCSVGWRSSGAADVALAL